MIPTRVILRTDDRWSGDPYRIDAELEAIITRAKTDPLTSLQWWMEHWYVDRRMRNCKHEGVILLPWRLKELLCFPTRQIYFRYGKMYRIEPEDDGIHGRVIDQPL